MQKFRDENLRVVIATSSSGDELEALLRQAHEAPRDVLRVEVSASAVDAENNGDSIASVRGGRLVDSSPAARTFRAAHRARWRVDRAKAGRS